MRLGIGCRKGTDEETIRAAVNEALAAHGIDRRAVKCAASIDLKAEEAGLERMSAMQAALAQDLARRMAGDPRIRPDAFRGELTREAFARFLVQNLPPLLRPRGESPAMLLCVVRRVLYEP